MNEMSVIELRICVELVDIMEENLWYDRKEVVTFLREVLEDEDLDNSSELIRKSFQRFDRAGFFERADGHLCITDLGIAEQWIMEERKWVLFRALDMEPA